MSKTLSLSSKSAPSQPFVKAGDLTRSKSTSFLKLPSARRPPTPQGKKRCHACDQVYTTHKRACPHCKAQDSVALANCESESWDFFDSEVKRLKQKLPASREELVTLVFKNAMDCRYNQPKRSAQLFSDVISIDSNHWESRIKLSWLQIRFNSFTPIIPLLEPVIASQTATVEQKQRAYNNIVCSFLFRLPADIESAEKFAKEGIALDKNGNPKLWENYGSVLKQQGRFAEAREAFSQACKLDPGSDFAQSNLSNVNKLEKKHKKQKSKGSSSDLDKENNSANVSKKSTKIERFKRM